MSSVRNSYNSVNMPSAQTNNNRNSGWPPINTMPPNNSMNSRSIRNSAKSGNMPSVQTGISRGRNRPPTAASVSSLSSRHTSRGEVPVFPPSPASFTVEGRPSGVGSRAESVYSRGPSAGSQAAFNGLPPDDFADFARQPRSTWHGDKKKKRQVLRVDADNLSTAAKIGILLMGTTPKKLEKVARAGQEKRQRERDRRRMRRGGGDDGALGYFDD